ncbi:Clavaminate synthase-like protein [Daldinia decipiens]|uniref:Clavaminate synthase-like protein n=1 Tax=Daldinia decipiens TaxID=326647 RepID=UPI0020C1D712|nr:Clavaminate synthase-like protein [Daldinia decipiens]KAI1662787.1 Clavaminate synthase-like protein [Daldinia decipiens]
MFRWPPTLDASPILSAKKLVNTSQVRRAFAAELVSHLEQHGFARLRNYGVAPHTTRVLFNYHYLFFNLSLIAKLSVRHPGGEAPARGYSPWIYEKTAIVRPDLHDAPNLNTFSSPHSHLFEVSTGSSKAQSLAARERFAIGPPGDYSFPTPQLAEALLPGFNRTTRGIYLKIIKACNMLLDTIELGLDVPPGTLNPLDTGGLGTELNLNFYPEVARDRIDGGGGDDVAMYRILPHLDLGVISALFQDGAGASGLELEVRGLGKGRCEFAPVFVEQEGDVVLLVSDTLERWTNGRLRAALHRVALPPEAGTSRVPERRSAVMFLRPPPTADIGPKPQFVSADNPALYDHITAGDYLRLSNKKLY